MSIKAINPGLEQLRSIQNQVSKPEKPSDPKESSFGDMFVNAIKEVDALQQEADQKITGMVLGNGVTPHNAMIALEKADIAFQLMNQIRSKIVRAYEEVMRTQV